MRAKIITSAAVLACAICGAGWYVWFWEYSPPYLEVDFLSLNRGHGIFIRLPDKHAVLVDGGQSGDIIHELSGLLPFYRRSIDSIFITESDPKSVGGLVDVLDRYSVGQIYTPKDMGTSTASEAVLSSARAKDIPIKELSAGGSVVLEKEEMAKGEIREKGTALPEVSMRALFPDYAFKFSNASPPQLILKLTFAKTSIVFAGDASKSIQNFLAKGFASSTDPIHADILEYANSGGAGNVSEKFIESIAPKYIVIKSSGASSKTSTTKISTSKKPQFTVHSYVSTIKDVGASSVKFLSDGNEIWQENKR